MSKDIKAMKEVTGMLDLVHKSKGQLIAPREVIESIAVLAPEAVSTIEHLMKNSTADSVRLKAALEVLALAGVTKETKISISADVTDMSEEELDTKLAALLGRTVIEGAAEVVLDRGEKDVTH